ncbi:MAG: S8 family serine peptidase [Vulcanimicrobiaceae bacterium]
MSAVVSSASPGTSVQVTLTTITPVGIGAPLTKVRRPAYVSANTAYVVFNVNSGSFTVSGTPSMTVSGLGSGGYTLGSLTVNTSGVATDTPVTTATTVNGTATFASSAGGVTLAAGDVAVFTISPGTAAQPSPTPAPEAAYTCPTSDTDDMTGRGGLSGSDATHHMTYRGRGFPATSTLLAVTYDRGTAIASASAIASRESATGATRVRTLDYSHIGKQTHVLSVPAGKLASVEATLRAQTGVESVAQTGLRRAPLTVSQRYTTGDPYFGGFSQGAPYFESAAIPGQWDMHAIKVDYAFEYSQANNGSGITNAAALGSSSVKIAIIDTGEDPTHPELSSKISRQRCYITDPNNNPSSSDFETDPMGHGTDVSGIAAADTGNSFGFAGTGGNVQIWAYRVFPEPDDSCANDNSDDNQCGANTADIASAIDDAVDAGVNVISMSLGGGSCSSGVDDDPTEGAAVANAIAANVVVVAAAGNSGTPGVEAPGCDTGVIAVGATSLDDGQSNGSGHTGGTSASPVEYVASYTDTGTPGADVHSTAAWGIVAPGGDPNGDGDDDDLHWIENIWTSTPFLATPNDVNFAGICTADYPNVSNVAPPVDCRTLIAGTSMATPHVAGAAALILSVNGTYQNPAKMRQLLCQTTDNINDTNQGCGRLDVYRAMATALGDPNLP